jgi:hypothetical protein
LEEYCISHCSSVFFNWIWLKLLPSTTAVDAAPSSSPTPPCPTPRLQSSPASPFTFGFVGCLFSGHWSIAWSTTALSGHPLERAYTAAWGSPQAIAASCTVIVLIRSTSSAMPRLRYVREEDAT